MKLTPYSERCGMVVEDVQLADLSDEEIVELRGYFADHGVLFFRDQDLPPAEHLTRTPCTSRRSRMVTPCSSSTRPTATGIATMTALMVNTQ